MIVINKSYTEEEMFLFFLGIIPKGVKFEQVKVLFNSEALIKVKELWDLAEAECNCICNGEIFIDGKLEDM